MYYPRAIHDGLFDCALHVSTPRQWGPCARPRRPVAIRCVPAHRRGARPVAARVSYLRLRPSPRLALHSERAHKHAWGYHQARFCCWRCAASCTTYAPTWPSWAERTCAYTRAKGQRTLAALVANAHRNVYIDRVTTPRGTRSTRLRREYGPDAHRALHWVTTQTLLDWCDDPESVASWTRGAADGASRRQPGLQGLRGRPSGGHERTKVDWSTVSRTPTAPAATAHKTHEAASSVAQKNNAPKKAPTRRRASPRTPRRRARRRSRRRSRSAPPRLGGRGPRAASLDLDLDAEWSRWSKAMVAAHLRPYDVVTSGLEQHALDHLETTVRAMADPKWEKRLTT